MIFLVSIRYFLTLEMEGPYCSSWTTTAISTMVLSPHWWSNFNNYFVNFGYLPSTGLIIRVTLVLLTQALVYLARDYYFSKYYHSALVIKLNNDLFNYYVVNFLNTITDDGLTSL